MTIIRSASGIRIDCDRCEHHTASPAQPVEALRRATGYVNLDGHDLCPQCSADLSPAARDRAPLAAPTDGSQGAA